MTDEQKKKCLDLLRADYELPKMLEELGVSKREYALRVSVIRSSGKKVMTS